MRHQNVFIYIVSIRQHCSFRGLLATHFFSGTFSCIRIDLTLIYKIIYKLGPKIFQNTLEKIGHSLWHPES